MKKNFTKQGLSLTELSIAIIIISLLITVIMKAGQLVDTSKLNNVIKELHENHHAVNKFQEKYNALPGDFIIASNYWSSTSNGDGDDIIESAEHFIAWQHLELASLIHGDFDGTTKIYKSKAFPSAHSGMRSENWLSINGNLSGNIMYHLLDYGTQGTVANSVAQTKFLSPKQLYYIDNKIDDGIAYTGKIIGANGFSQDNSSQEGTCACPAVLSECSTDYDLTKTGKQCWLIYKMQKK